VAIERIRGAVSAQQSVDPKAATAEPKHDFTAVMKRIEARAESVETLENGAKLYHLPGGREVEQVPGKSPYVTKKGTWPQPTDTKPTTPATTTPTTTTTPSTTTPTTTTTAPTTTTTPAKTTPTTTTTPSTTATTPSK
jgi:hypothetical protein